ncbi:alpha-L-fucosidase [Cohnella sp. GbtcB17]|uniref:alpha-L-fucosidase n=1 Tax=Cohnella sp. GbtcB17 TaxID=2824762 RepID=UPI0034D65D1C
MRRRYKGMVRQAQTSGVNQGFGDRRFGLFIHWGLYAIPGWHEQIQMRQRMDKSQYQTLQAQFDPLRFDPDAWIDLAEQAGMKYICFTTKHHDGFCLWDTQYTAFKITNTPYGRDTLAMLADACGRRGMGLSLYYSIPDWHHPNGYNPLSSHQVPPVPEDEPDMDRYIDFVKNQIAELCTNYGQIFSFFWDIPPRIYDPSLNAMIRRMQPGILINDRGYDEGDYSTPERHVPAGWKFDKPTEAVQSIGRQSWGYRTNEDYYSLQFLTQSIAKIMAMGGNYALNVGPKADGTIPDIGAHTIRAVGQWYQSVKEAYEGAEPISALFGRDDLMFTRKGNALYVHLVPTPESSGIILNPVTVMPHSAILLNNGAAVKAVVEKMPTLANEKDYLHLFDIPVNEFVSQVIVIKLVFDDLSGIVGSFESVGQLENRF